MPRSFLRLLLSPSDAVLSEPWSTPATSLSASGAVQAHRLTLDAFPDGFFTAHGEIWRKVLVRQILGHRERELWHNLRTPESRRLEWLLGRVVAKDAVRQHVKERYGVVLCPADVEILPDGNGRPVVTGRWTDQVPCVPLVSLSHSAGVAVAVVADCEVGRGVGVDIEHMGRMNEHVEALAFTSRERELLSSVSGSQKDGWPLRFWCAKEAAAKALGQGMVGGPQALVVQALDTKSGIAQISLAGELAHRVREADGIILTAFTAREGDLVVATSLYKSEEVDNKA
jgi:phosphopantetheine--protein transferase-like protein